MPVALRNTHFTQYYNRRALHKTANRFPNNQHQATPGVFTAGQSDPDIEFRKFEDLFSLRDDTGRP